MTFTETVAEGYAACGLAAPARVGVALSGGADSVALLAATLRLGFEAVPLHCNFHLRGAESDRDEVFVRSLCSRLGIEESLLTVDFDVARQMRQSGESTEMACRTLRYRWFADRAEALGLDAVAIGHHADDDAETLILNLMRGTGLRGLAGMPRRRQGFVRPMMGLTRADVLRFLQKEGLTYVTDSTNLADEYTRNRVRHNVLPALEEARPGARAGVASTIANLRSDLALFDELIERRAAELTGADGSVDLVAVAASANGADLLYHILRRRADGITHRTASEILAAREHSGATFPLSDVLTLAVDRGRLLFVTPENDAAPEEVTFPLSALLDGAVRLPLGMTAELVDASLMRPDRSGRTLWLSASIMEGRECLLTLRRWRQGDRLEPFGMRGSRLLSDLFSDAKIPVHRKARMWVLEHEGIILWVPGLRASRHFAVTSADSRAVRMALTD